MTKPPTDIAQRYLSALRLQLDAPQSGGVAAARAVGRAAIAAGCNTLDLVRMHEQTLLALAPNYDFATASNGLQRRTGRFFTETLVPMENAIAPRVIRSRRSPSALRACASTPES